MFSAEIELPDADADEPLPALVLHPDNITDINSKDNARAKPLLFILLPPQIIKCLVSCIESYKIILDIKHKTNKQIWTNIRIIA